MPGRPPGSHGATRPDGRRQFSVLIPGDVVDRFTAAVQSRGVDRADATARALTLMADALNETPPILERITGFRAD